MWKVLSASFCDVGFIFWTPRGAVMVPTPVGWTPVPSLDSGVGWGIKYVGVKIFLLSKAKRYNGIRVFGL